jgi:hypothetical protein
MASAWKQTQWTGTTDPKVLAQFTAYARKFRRGTLWLRVYKEPYFLGCQYHFTNSQGPNSENSYSGLLPPEFNGLSIEQAQTEVTRRVTESMDHSAP